MSTYEDYDQTSRAYDHTRVPVGVEIIAGCFARGGKRLHEMVVLDAGCGTGSYSRELLRYVDRVCAVDRSDGMLAVARGKLAGARAEVHQADLRELPFAAQSFDGIMVNQVLHHIEGQETVIAKLAGLLRPGGVIVINTCSREQIFQGFWTTAFVPQAAARMADRYRSLDALERALREAGLTPRGRFVPTDAIVFGDAYFDFRGPLRKEWRDGDSLWALATEAELEVALRRVRDLDQRGELEAFIAKHDAARPSVGQITFIAASR